MSFCPGVRMGDETIKFEEGSKYPIISETLCSGCGICVKKCPFNAITIVNTPEAVEAEASHRYGVNQFALFRLPIPRQGKVLGIIGRNGAGKSTVLRILAGEIKPNLGNITDAPDWDEIIQFYRGSELQSYFENLSKGVLKISYKPQYITNIPKVYNGVVGDLIAKVDERGVAEKLMRDLYLETIWGSQLSTLSGGELQCVAIAATAAKEVDVYLFDEPSSYLDIFQRITAAKIIRGLAETGKTVICVEHDLAALDFLSDYTCVLFGEPGVYGIVSHPYGVKEGINIFLDGYLPDENIRFREEGITFSKAPVPKIVQKEVSHLLVYNGFEIKLDGFKLEAHSGDVKKSEVIGILGANGIGKTTFIKVLAGLLKPDTPFTGTGTLKVSYKPQYLENTYNGSVREFLLSVAKTPVLDPSTKSGIITPLELGDLMDKPIPILSGGELQRVAIAGCLLRDADIYLIDEPSAFLDVEQRFAAAKIIRRIVESKGKAAFIIEHDLIMCDHVADRLIIFEGYPSRKGLANSPQDMRGGMNMFLKMMNITLRRDVKTGRPRINKIGSKLDTAQKSIGEYYYVPVKK